MMVLLEATLSSVPFGLISIAPATLMMQAELGGAAAAGPFPELDVQAPAGLGVDDVVAAAHAARG
jgi:hypothetical protein